MPRLSSHACAELWLLSQFRTLFGKFFIMYWRSPSYNATRFVMTVLIMHPLLPDQMPKVALVSALSLAVLDF
jgi:hypothetical protein